MEHSTKGALINKSTKRGIVSMKKSVKMMGIFLFFGAVFGLLVLSPQDSTAKEVKFVLVGAPEGGAEVSAESMALNMYLGALDYRFRTFHELKGKYELKYVHTLFADADECLTGVASGAAEMTFSGPHYLEALEPAWKLGESPGVFDSWEHFMKTMKTPAWKALHEKMAKEKGITILKWMANIGDFYLYTNKGPINTMADLKGQKIRFPGGEGFAKALKAMETTPISLPYTEVVTALQTNMIDGLLTDMFAAFYFYELPRYTQYCVKSAWAIQPISFVVNTSWWESLPPKERQAIQDVFDRIDVSMFFSGAQAGITQGWAAGPKTKLLTLSAAENDKLKKAMREGAKDVLSGIDPKLIEAIEASR
jgi:TRAP-type C4-dicarboxylate transport system substrate-binding protein